MSNTPTLTVTFVRHGESMDNLRDVWAGWKDAPLSNHGMNQARAVGNALASTHFAAIYASPLKRAYSTAEAVYEKQPEPKPTFESTLLIREQHFGIAEGNKWVWNMVPNLSLEEHHARGLFPVMEGRDDKFPEGESLDDVAKRADQAIQDFVLSNVRKAAQEGKKGLHVALVSHGICISELVTALLTKDESGQHPGQKFRGMRNTAWTRITVDVKGSREGEPMELVDGELLPLKVSLTHFNEFSHLETVKRQKGGIGSSAHDPKQRDIRAYFSGGAVGVDTEEGRSESNVEDEAEVVFKGETPGISSL
ncbi:phosphoglycerate mutase-like protein [Irpex rosettiformis]|uniref:Phosphoglycerate mutase-like protein n=1 Tax=Irpex rosettiformis TaxID=378272 RepID=A0ACB8U0M3_9APHY|nr:phosphoglycerate mutase-like protein [Irpex rosettiformis]